jgi:hypothetical protein
MKAKNRLGRIPRRAAPESVTIERSGCPAAVLVSQSLFNIRKVFSAVSTAARSHSKSGYTRPVHVDLTSPEYAYDGHSRGLANPLFVGIYAMVLEWRAQ